MTEIGSRIKKLRREKDWTQADLAELAGISQRNISRYESGNIEPRKSTVLKLANVFGVSTEELLGKIELSDGSPPKDPELSRLMSAIAALPKEKREALLKVINIVIREDRIQSAIAS